MPGDLRSRSGLSGGAGNTTYDPRRASMVWNQTIDTCLWAGMPENATELAKVMISSSLYSLYRLLVIIGDGRSSARLVDVHASLERFCDSGDVETALVWFNRSNVDAVGAVAWSVMIESLASHDMIAKLDDAFQRTLTNGANDSLAQTFTQRVTVYHVRCQHETSTGPRHFRCGTEVVDEMMHVNNDIRKRFAMVRAV
ncbi:hypothetical protein JOM56_007051 [Amanita muscaria]